MQLNFDKYIFYIYQIMHGCLDISYNIYIQVKKKAFKINVKIGAVGMTED